MGWSEEAKVRLTHLDSEIEALDQDDAGTQVARRVLGEARDTLANKRARDAWSGERATVVWGKLHEVEEQLQRRETKAAPLIYEAREHLEYDRNRLEEFERTLSKTVGEAERADLARSVIHGAHVSSATRRTSERNHNRGVIMVGVSALVAAAGLVVWQANSTTALLAPPSGNPGMSRLGLMVLVLAAGGLGGLLSAAYSLFLNLPQLDDTRWFDPKPGLALAKVTFGMLSGFLGVLLVSTQVITGVYATSGALFVLGVVFGYSQQALTGVFDRKAAELVDPGKTSASASSLAARTGDEVTATSSESTAALPETARISAGGSPAGSDRSRVSASNLVSGGTKAGRVSGDGAGDHPHMTLFKVDLYVADGSR